MHNLRLGHDGSLLWFLGVLLQLIAQERAMRALRGLILAATLALLLTAIVDRIFARVVAVRAYNPEATILQVVQRSINPPYKEKQPYHTTMDFAQATIVPVACAYGPCNHQAPKPIPPNCYSTRGKAECTTYQCFPLTLTARTLCEPKMGTDICIHCRQDKSSSCY